MRFMPQVEGASTLKELSAGPRRASAQCRQRLPCVSGRLKEEKKRRLCPSAGGASGSLCPKIHKTTAQTDTPASDLTSSSRVRQNLKVTKPCLWPGHVCPTAGKPTKLQIYVY